MHASPNPRRLQPCRLCGRVTKKGTTEHHLIPRCCHRNKWFRKRFTRAEMQQTIPVCIQCHRTIHNMVPSEKELGRHYNTVELLMAHEQVGRFVDWVRDRT